MSYNWVIGVVSVAAVFHYIFVSRFQGLLTLDGIFVPAQWMMVVGTLLLLQPHDPRDSRYSLVIAVPMLLYTSASILTYALLLGRPGRGSTRKKVVQALRPTRFVVGLLVLSMAITVAYYQAVGYSVFLVGIRDLLSGESSNYTNLRVDSYSSSRNLFPGYVNQFKNAILPALSVVVIFYLFQARKRHRRLLSGILLLIILVSLLGTGQRGAFVQFALILLTFLYQVDRRRFATRAPLILAIMAPLLMFITFLLGRSADRFKEGSGLFGKSLVILSELVKRFFYDNQFSGQMAFWYTFDRPVQNGAEWWSSLSVVLPGVQQSGPNLSQQVFQSLYGTPRGTAPPSMWGSVFYNFGWSGIILTPLLMGVVYQIITYRSMRRGSRNSLEVIGMSGFFVIFGNWIAGGPEYLLNAGGLTFLSLWWIGRRISAGTSVAPDSGSSSGHAPPEPALCSASTKDHVQAHRPKMRFESPGVTTQRSP